MHEKLLHSYELPEPDIDILHENVNSERQKELLREPSKTMRYKWCLYARE